MNWVSVIYQPASIKAIWLEDEILKGGLVKMALDFKGKKLIILGDRDGIPGPAIEACLKNSGAEIIFNTTECFV